MKRFLIIAAVWCLFTAAWVLAIVLGAELLVGGIVVGWLGYGAGMAVADRLGARP